MRWAPLEFTAPVCWGAAAFTVWALEPVVPPLALVATGIVLAVVLPVLALLALVLLLGDCPTGIMP